VRYFLATLSLALLLLAGCDDKALNETAEGWESNGVVFLKPVAWDSDAKGTVIVGILDNRSTQTQHVHLLIGLYGHSDNLLDTVEATFNNLPPGRRTVTLKVSTLGTAYLKMKTFYATPR
jgi:hypothetical protein